jgi:hypothetical protein
MSTTAKLPSKLVEISRRELGIEEVDGTNCGPRVNDYKAATNLPPKESWPWCAAFVDFCVMRAMEATGVIETATFKRPTTAGAWDLINWSLRQDDSTQTKKFPGDDIKAGDILVYTFSHCGIAAEDAHGGMVVTHEGNTDKEGSREGGGVFRKTRSTSRVKARIRFTV